jgi:hypothetical protein
MGVNGAVAAAASLMTDHKSSTTGGNVGCHMMPQSGMGLKGAPMFNPTVKNTS